MPVADLSVVPLAEMALASWRASPTDFPDLGTIYPHEDQERRAAALDRALDRIDDTLGGGFLTRMDAERALRKIVPCAVEIVAIALEVSDPSLQALLREGMLDISLTLARRARKLDRAVGLIDVLQAARNAWTACALQILLGRPLRLTPGIFAYSMLYPYSDNFLDDLKISPDTKLRFSHGFRLRLQGASLPGLIWELVSMIEGEFARAQYPAVYDSLLAFMPRSGTVFRSFNPPTPMPISTGSPLPKEVHRSSPPPTWLPAN